MSESGVLVIDQNTTNTGKYDRWTDIIEVVIPWRLEQIDAHAFHGCTSLKKITFEDGSELAVIGKCAFISCAAL